MAAFVRFPSTFWSVIQGQPDRARVEVFTRYRTPIYQFIRGKGFQEPDAEDLTQEVFARVCRDEFLRKADSSKGRFRTLLLSVTRHVILQELDRRRRRRTNPLPEEGAALEAPAEDSEFERLWLGHLLTLALQKLQQEQKPGGPRGYDALMLHRFQGMSYEQVAGRLGVSVSDVTNWLHQAKKKLEEILPALVREYASSEEEWIEEMRLLARASEPGEGK